MLFLLFTLCYSPPHHTLGLRHRVVTQQLDCGTKTLEVGPLCVCVYKGEGYKTHPPPLLLTKL